MRIWIATLLSLGFTCGLGYVYFKAPKLSTIGANSILNDGDAKILGVRKIEITDRSPIFLGNEAILHTSGGVKLWDIDKDELHSIPLGDHDFEYVHLVSYGHNKDLVMYDNKKRVFFQTSVNNGEIKDRMDLEGFYVGGIANQNFGFIIFSTGKVGLFNDDRLKVLDSTIVFNSAKMMRKRQFIDYSGFNAQSNFVIERYDQEGLVSSCELPIQNVASSDLSEDGKHILVYSSNLDQSQLWEYKILSCEDGAILWEKTVGRVLEKRVFDPITETSRDGEFSGKERTPLISYPSFCGSSVCVNQLDETGGLSRGFSVVACFDVKTGESTTKYGRQNNGFQGDPNSIVGPMYCEDRNLLFFTKYSPFLNLVKIGNYESKRAYLDGSGVEKFKEWANKSRAITIVNLGTELFWTTQNRIMFYSADGLMVVVGK